MKLRFNANDQNSAKLRKIQGEYKKKFFPAKISLDALSNLSMELGVDLARARLNLTPIK